MITVSEAWKQAQQKTIVPVSHVRINYVVSNRTTVAGATNIHAIYGSASDSADSAYSEYTGFLKAADLNEAVTQTTSSSTGGISVTPRNFATLALNNWVLGTNTPFVSGAVKGSGFVGNHLSNSDGSIDTDYQPRVCIPFDAAYTGLPGLTIFWSDNNGWATSFTVMAYNGSERTVYKNVTSNDSCRTVVEFTSEQSQATFDQIRIKINAWSLPNAEPRIYAVQFGKVLHFDKSDITEYSYSASVDPISSEMSHSEISFSIDNHDGSWDPENPSGNYASLSDGQMLEVEYGFDINSETEWISAGMFCLTEWDCSADGITMNFVAEDAMCLLDVPFNSMFSEDPTEDIEYSSLDNILQTALKPIGGCSIAISSSIAIPNGCPIVVDKSNNLTCAEIIQLACNAVGAVAFFKGNKLVVKKYSDCTSLSDYTISSVSSSGVVANVYNSHYSKNSAVNAVLVEYEDIDGDDKTCKWYGTASLTSPTGNGITQTFSNELVRYDDLAKVLASTAYDYLNNRDTINGEFRIDPRLELMDLVTVKTKYNTTGSPLLITSITLTYGGAFTGVYEGRIIPGTM